MIYTMNKLMYAVLREGTKASRGMTDTEILTYLQTNLNLLNITAFVVKN